MVFRRSCAIYSRMAVGTWIPDLSGIDGGQAFPMRPEEMMEALGNDEGTPQCSAFSEDAASNFQCQ